MANQTPTVGAFLRKGQNVPNRLLRDGIITSDRINAISAEAEICFYRLLVVCDDFGRMDARLPILKAQCYPLRDSTTQTKIESYLAELSEHGLIMRYQDSENKPFLAVDKWEQRQRSRPKYVGPMDDGCTPIVGNLSDNCRTDVGLGKGKGKGKGATSRAGRELHAYPQDWKPSEKTAENLVREFNLAPEDVDRYVDAFRDRCLARGYRYADFDAAFRNCVKDDWPKYRINGAIGRIRSIV
jgi:hypothetical protein